MKPQVHVHAVHRIKTLTCIVCVAAGSPRSNIFFFVLALLWRQPVIASKWRPSVPWHCWEENNANDAVGAPDQGSHAPEKTRTHHFLFFSWLELLWLLFLEAVPEWSVWLLALLQCLGFLLGKVNYCWMPSDPSSMCIRTLGAMNLSTGHTGKWCMTLRN